MKTIVAAGMLSAALMGTAQAAPAIPMDAGLATSAAPVITDVAWLSRYGKLCFHGPVWIPACHATDRPVGYMVGHWNAIGTRYIPGHYY